MDESAAPSDNEHRQRLDQCFLDARFHRGAIYGREKEKAALMQAHERVVQKRTELHPIGHKDSLNSRQPQAIYNCNVSEQQQQNPSEFVLIHGASGMGKTGLAHVVRQHVESVNGGSGDGSGYFITIHLGAACDDGQYVKGGPQQQKHGAFIEAFTEFARCVADHDDDVARLRRALRCLSSTSCRALLQAIPALKILLEGESMTKPDQSSLATTTEETPSLCRSEASSVVAEPELVNAVVVDGTKPSWHLQSSASLENNCPAASTTCDLKDALCHFVQAVAATLTEHPVIYLLDDLHLADEYTLGVIQAMVENNSMNGTLFIGTSRDDAEYASRWTLIHHKLSESSVRLTCLSLTSWERCNVVELIADVLQVDTERAAQLESIMSEDMRANVVWTWEFLRELHRRQLLQFDMSSHKWCWNGSDIRALELRNDTMIQARIQALPAKYQEYLIMAACLGPTLDTVMLQRLFSCSDETFGCFLNKAKASDLICYQDSRAAWCFTHDVIQAVIIDGMPTRERTEHHYRIGRMLWKLFDLDELGHFIFLVVGQLLLAVDCMIDEREKRAVAKLCLCAGVRAVRLSQFQASLRYLEQGIALLGPNAWSDAYESALDLYSAAAEVANSLGYSDRVHDLARSILDYAKCFRDTLRGQAAMVHALGSNGQFDEAVQLAFDVLGKLGEPIPLQTSSLRQYVEFTNLRRRLGSKSSESLLRLPHMVDADKLAAMQMLNLVFMYALLTNDELIPALTFRMVRITLDHGICAVSCVGLALFSCALCKYVEALSW
jgi:predicted ATPase